MLRGGILEYTSAETFRIGAPKRSRCAASKKKGPHDAAPMSFPRDGVAGRRCDYSLRERCELDIDPVDPVEVSLDVPLVDPLELPSIDPLDVPLVEPVDDP